MQWHVEVRHDVIKGQWNELYKTCVYWEFYYIIAHNNKDYYIHYYNFRDNWQAANQVAQRILTTADFSPENKSNLWIKIRDALPIKHKKQIRQWWRKW